MGIQMDQAFLGNGKQSAAVCKALSYGKARDLCCAADDWHGGFWSSDMNSFNHYAYGSVADWMYGMAAGIQICEDAPGYEKICIVPHTSEKLDWFEASVETRHGLVSSRWSKIPAGGYVFHQM